jgi:hypothetical protein
MSLRSAVASAMVALTVGSSGGAAAATQMFKCIVGGRTVYQQQGCPVDAEPAKTPGTPASAPAKAASAAAAAASAHRLKPPSRPASSVPATPR